jgi:hypothetical protein
MAREQRAFIARDKNGELYFYIDKPKLREDGTFIGTGFVSHPYAFQEIKKCDCKKCTITLDEEPINK